MVEPQVTNHGLGVLRARFPWPEAPGAEPHMHGWFGEGNRRLLDYTFRHHKAAGASPKVIVELGSWLGKSTQYLLENTTADVIAIDHWKGSQEHLSAPKDYPLLPCLYETFLANCWQWRERLIPVRMTTTDGIALLRDLAIVPDLAYVDAAHDYESVLSDIQGLLTLNSEIDLTGDDFSPEWPGVCRAVRTVSLGTGRTLQGYGNAWRLALKQ